MHMRSQQLLIPVLVSSLCSIIACRQPQQQQQQRQPVEEFKGRIVRIDPEMDKVVPRDAQIEKLASGFGFTEGPVWVPRDGGYLLFSDIPNNVIRRWTPGGQVTVFLEKSGYEGEVPAEGPKVFGSNGLTLDAQGRLIICEHGNRRVTRLEDGGKRTVLADRFEGKRLNSPNDIVRKSDGSLYFTDPPYGLPKQDEDPAKELNFNGIFRLQDGRLTLLYREMSRPNGLAFSPDEKYLYVANSDPKRKIWMRFEVTRTGTLANPEVFYDATTMVGEGLPDGLKVDKEGRLYCTGPGGILVLTPNGRLIGKIELPEIPANLAFGDQDGKTLYITARTSLYRVRLNVEGIRP